ncbi:MAG: archease [Thermodesulfovibrionales bacterium]|nr:archease [Thermodesulfovibrionales bacterium]
MNQFEIIDISGDVGIKAFGKSLEELFANAAIGMYSLITALEGIEPEKSINVSIESNSLEGLLVSWLNELVFQFDTYGFIGKKIVITGITPSLTLPPRGGVMGGGGICTLKATISGEEFDTERHERKLLIKAATYHRLKVEKVKDIWQADIIFDI